MKKTSLSISLLGYGWLGQALAKYWDKNCPDYDYKTFSRSGRNESTPFTLDNQTQKLPKDIQESDVLFLSIPPGREVEVYHQNILKLTRLLPSSHRVIMIGTTSVFEENESTCTEETEPITRSLRSKILRESELSFLKHFENGLIIRSAGQIGEDRVPARFLAKKEQQSQMPQGNVPVNIIHKDDLVRICTLALKESLTGILHAVSPYHPEKSDYYHHQARVLGLELLPFPKGEPSHKKIEGLTLEKLGYTFINEKCEL